MLTRDIFHLSRGVALLLLLGGPGVFVLREGGWTGYLLYGIYVIATLSMFDSIRDRWRAGGRPVIWFDLAAAGVGVVFCLLLLR